MRAARVILLYALAVVLLGALLSPWLFWLTQAHWPFRRVFDRVLLVVALAGLWPVLRSVGIRSLPELGYERTPAWWRQAAWGFGAGTLSLGFCAVLLRAFTGWNNNIAGNLASAVAVAIIEETFFRGGIFNTLRRGLPMAWAVLVSSIVYAGLHFCKPSEPVTVTWLSGFQHLGQIAGNFSASVNWIGLVTLILAGSVLALVFVWTKSLYFSIGLHAGWVFAIKTAGAPLRDSLWAWPVLLVVLGLCWRQFGRRST